MSDIDIENMTSELCGENVLFYLKKEKRTMNLIEWKKMYSNNDTDISMKWLWDYTGYK